MSDELVDIERRLEAKGLFDRSSSSLSLRVPGENAALFTLGGDAPRTLELDAETDEHAAIHACVYRARQDVGGVVVGTSRWTTALASLGIAVPSLFDEQARHIGPGAPPIAERDLSSLERALSTGTNALVIGNLRIGLGSTPNRVVLNADLFEKCTKAFVVASATGGSVHGLPPWACELWYERLRKDQLRAAAAYGAGRVPSGMDAY